MNKLNLREVFSCNAPHTVLPQLLFYCPDNTGQMIKFYQSHTLTELWQPAQTTELQATQRLTQGTNFFLAYITTSPTCKKSNCHNKKALQRTWKMHWSQYALNALKVKHSVKHYLMLLNTNRFAGLAFNTNDNTSIPVLQRDVLHWQHAVYKLCCSYASTWLALFWLHEDYWLTNYYKTIRKAKSLCNRLNKAVKQHPNDGS